MKFGSQKGFSLVELLVVVGIIGVLAAVGVPKYQRYMARSKNVAALTRGTEIAKAQEVYKISNTTYATGAAQLDPNNDIPAIPASTGFLAEAWVVPTTTTWGWSVQAPIGNLGACQNAGHTVAYSETGMTAGSDQVPGC